MKAYLLKVLVIDFENYGVDEAVNTIEQNTSYAVIDSESADIDWSDSHPLNQIGLRKEEATRIFK